LTRPRQVRRQLAASQANRVLALIKMKQ
jgi:hypothetical protein